MNFGNINVAKTERRSRYALSVAISVLLTALISLGQSAFAEHLVKMDAGQAQASVLTSWSQKGSKSTFTVRDGEDPREIVELINEEISGVKAKVRAGKIQIKGKPLSELLPLLAEINLEEEEDFGALASVSFDTDFDSGSSLRAKKVADVKKLLSDANTVAIGKVIGIQRGTFPRTLVMVQILRGPKGTLGESIKKGGKIKFEPSFTRKKDQVDWQVQSNQVNAGAWYARPGDKVVIRIGSTLKGAYEAEIFERR